MAAMGEMIGAISHQWKQPLNGIYILIQALESDLVLDGVISKENGKEALDDMREQINFMFETMKEFRNFFKPSKDKKTFDIQNSILEVSKILKAQFLKYNIELQIEKSSIDLEYIGYENEFKQVILNILNNAKDVLISRKVPTIKISIDKSDNYINIYISDNGGGIPDDIIDKIFESYFSTKGENGTGIGLYMSKMIIENMDGKIEAFNIESGACFKISLKR
jgi:signal transduction histidine kinase